VSSPNARPRLASNSYFVRDGEHFLPTELARSPWHGTKWIAGAPTSCLLASCAEDPELDEGFAIARFQLDIFGRVPNLPLSHAITVLRNGRQTKLHCISLLAKGEVVAQAHVLRVRQAETPVFALPSGYPKPADMPSGNVPELAQMGGSVSFRRVSGDPGVPGRAVWWMTMTDGEVIAGEKTSNFVKACLFADFGHGFGNALRPTEWAMPNLDITVQFMRMPVGDWFLLDAETHTAGNGHGAAHTLFADEQGVYARTLQTVFIAPR
jgi:hypothetical protein